MIGVNHLLFSMAGGIGPDAYRFDCRVPPTGRLIHVSNFTPLQGIALSHARVSHWRHISSARQRLALHGPQACPFCSPLWSAACAGLCLVQPDQSQLYARQHRLDDRRRSLRRQARTLSPAYSDPICVIRKYLLSRPLWHTEEISVRACAEPIASSIFKPPRQRAPPIPDGEPALTTCPNLRANKWNSRQNTRRSARSARRLW